MPRPRRIAPARGGLTALALLALWLAPVGGAHAAPFALDPNGTSPSVAVDAAGTAHFVWLSQVPGSPQTIGYCDAARGATACAHRQSFDLPGPNAPSSNSASGALVVLVPGTGTVLVVAPRQVDNDTLLWRSDDGGVSFAGPATIATRTGTHGTDYRNAVLGPGDVVSLGYANPGAYFQSDPLGGPPPSADAQLPAAPGGTLVYDVVTAIDNGIPIVAGWNGPGTGHRYQVGFYRWSGGGDINDASTWTGPTIVAEGDTTTLAAGPSGVFLVSRGYRASSLPSQPQVQKFNGTTFGTPVPFGTDGDDNLDATEPSAGYLIVADRHKGSSGDTVHLEVSRDGGATFTGMDVATGTPFPLRVGAAPDGTGFVAYRSNGTLFAAPFDAGAAPPPVAGRTVTVAATSGTVLVRAPGARGFTKLGKDRSSIPVGSEVDTTAGRVALTAAVGTGTTATKAGEFYDGRFRVSQPRSAHALLTATLTGPLGCGRARAARRKRPGRRLWGNAKGAFQTSGHRAAATVRGTVWLVEDRCDGSTAVTVKKGVVSVRDLVRKRTVVVRAGHTIVVRR